MKKSFSVLLLSALIVLSSCEAVKNTNNTQRGAAMGSVLGGVLGAVIANNTGGKSEVGAVVGAVAGGVAGGLIGNKMDKQAKEIKEILPGAEVVKVDNGEGLQVVLGEANRDGIKFSTNSASLENQAKLNVEKLATIFNKEVNTNITVIGHTDDVGTDQYNQQLSNRRAAAVSDYLVQNGISRNRITTKGMGESEPKVPNTNEANRMQNRRVEIYITANEKMIEEAQKQARE